MALLDRVATLVKANLNDLVDRAENPEKMLKQVILDMENQFMQVKTQVAIALADLHLLERKRKDNGEMHSGWMRKAELAVDKKDDEMARAALERAMSFGQLTESFDQQIADQDDPGRVVEIGAETVGDEAGGSTRQGGLADHAAEAGTSRQSRRRCTAGSNRREPHV